jgi:integrase/recombinase XerD
MASISIILRKDKIKKNGKAPLYFLVYQNEKKTKISSKIYIDPNNWDSPKMKIKKAEPNYIRLNNLLQNRISEFQDTLLVNGSLITSEVTSYQIKEQLIGKKVKEFLSFAEQILNDYKTNNQIGTYDKNKGVIEKLKVYIKKPELSFGEITPTFLKAYERYLRSKLKNKTNTVGKDFKFIRKVFNEAINLGFIEQKNSPFKKYKIQSEKTERVYLTEDELMKIEKVELTPKSKISLHRDMFVFASYSGVRISDILFLTWQNFTGSHINVTTIKTDSQLSIKLTNKALEIIQKYKPKKKAKQKFVFPILPNDIDFKDAQVIDTAISRATSLINSSLNDITKKIKLEKHISFHTSRHTFATLALQKGMRIEYLSKILGHSNLRETQIYAKIVNPDLDKAMDLFND